MKKLLVTIVIGLTALGAHAHGFEHRGYDHRSGGWGWVAPAIIGGTVVYAATRPPVVVQQPTVIVQPQYQTPLGYHWEAVLDATCNCYRSVLVPN